jgi:hypothetical protein
VSRCGFRGRCEPPGAMTASHDTRLRGTMYSRPSLLFLGAAALVGTQLGVGIIVREQQ